VFNLVGQLFKILLLLHQAEYSLGIVRKLYQSYSVQRLYVAIVLEDVRDNVLDLLLVVLHGPARSPLFLATVTNQKYEVSVHKLERAK